jgi:hypothetical protein
MDVVRIGVCSALLIADAAPDCCPLLGGLLGVEIDACLCLALDLNILGVLDINIPKLDIIASIMTSCGLPGPAPGFVCP